MTIKFSGKVFKYPGPGGWHFVALPKKESAKIAETKTIKKGNWGYVPVTVTIGKTTWQTGIWPQKKESVYLLVIKAPVRKKEGISHGDRVRASIAIR